MPWVNLNLDLQWAIDHANLCSALSCLILISEKRDIFLLSRLAFSTLIVRAQTLPLNNGASAVICLHLLLLILVFTDPSLVFS